jgi:Na+:H+ antiporter, NhaA family
MGVFFGLVVGKQLGIFTAVVVSTRFGIAQLPSNVEYRHMYGVSILCGIGFTMAIFVANLAFTNGQQLDIAKLSIVLASTACAVIGAGILRATLPNQKTLTPAK